MKVIFIIMGLLIFVSASYAQEDNEVLPDINIVCEPPGPVLPLSDKQTEAIDEINSNILLEQKAPFILNIKSSSTKPWKKDYTDILYQTFKDPDLNPLFEQQISEDDLSKINCPAFNYLEKEEKIKFFITYLAAIAQNSSKYENEAIHYSVGDKTTNYGLLQIDPSSARMHAGSIVGRSVRGNQLVNPETNLKVAAYILKHQISGKISTGRLFPDKTYYWPSLKNEQQNILSNFEANAENLPFCLPPKAIIVDETPLKAIIVNEEDLSPSPLKAIFVNEEIEKAPTQRLPPGKYRKISERPIINKPIIFTEKPKAKIKTPSVYPPDKRGLNINDFSKRLNKLSENSGGFCARGVRKSLNVLFGYGPDGGPSAKKYDEEFLSKWKKGNSCFKKSKDNGDFQDYDIRVLEPKDSVQAGHIEIYFDGKWYSDFQQRLSLWNNGISKYKSKNLYRLSDCSKRTSFIKAFLKSLSEGLLDESCANTTVINSDEFTPINLSDVLLAQNKEWTIKEIAINQGSEYILFKDKKIISRDSNSPFILIDKIQDEALRKTLVQNTLEKWIQRDGKENVQEYILELEIMTELQKEALTNLGFILPLNIKTLGK